MKQGYKSFTRKPVCPFPHTAFPQPPFTIFIQACMENGWHLQTSSAFSKERANRWKHAAWENTSICDFSWYSHCWAIWFPLHFCFGHTESRKAPVHTFSQFWIKKNPTGLYIPSFWIASLLLFFFLSNHLLVGFFSHVFFHYFLTATPSHVWLLSGAFKHGLIFVRNWQESYQGIWRKSREREIHPSRSSSLNKGLSPRASHASSRAGAQVALRTTCSEEFHTLIGQPAVENQPPQCPIHAQTGDEE